MSWWMYLLGLFAFAVSLIALYKVRAAWPVTTYLTGTRHDVEVDGEVKSVPDARPQEFAKWYFLALFAWVPWAIWMYYADPSLPLRGYSFWFWLFFISALVLTVVSFIIPRFSLIRFVHLLGIAVVISLVIQYVVLWVNTHRHVPVSLVDCAIVRDDLRDAAVENRAAQQKLAETPPTAPERGQVEADADEASKALQAQQDIITGNAPLYLSRTDCGPANEVTFRFDVADPGNDNCGVSVDMTVWNVVDGWGNTEPEYFDVKIDPDDPAPTKKMLDKFQWDGKLIVVKATKSEDADYPGYVWQLKGYEYSTGGAKYPSVIASDLLGVPASQGPTGGSIDTEPCDGE